MRTSPSSSDRRKRWIAFCGPSSTSWFWARAPWRRTRRPSPMGINLSAIPATSWIGRVARWPLGRIPSATVVPVLQGALRGKKWIVGSSTHGCWLGSYEWAQRRMFETVIQPDDVVYDVGAHVGFYTLLAATLTHRGGHVVAFEPLPRNLEYLRRHLRLNGTTNVTVVEGALWEDTGGVRILDGPASAEVRVDPRGTIAVHSLTLAHVVFEGGLAAPTVLKIDVEGAEIRVLRGGLKT